MGTPMAVSFANLFMNKFECDLLDSFEKEHHKRPLLWLRFIDDIFFIWDGDESSLKVFTDYCNSFASKKSMKSNIRFTSSYSQSNVIFLDMIVNIRADKIFTSIYSKSVDTHTYLHASSFHSRSTILSLPKSQFIRIRRLCSSLEDFKAQSSKFIDFFIRRGYKKNHLVKTVNEVSEMSRDTLLTPKKSVNSSDTPVRTVLSISWHPRLQFLQKCLRSSHNEFSKKFDYIKKTFPEAPMVAFRRNQTLRNVLVRARHGEPQKPACFSVNKSSRSILVKNMAKTTDVVNEKSGMTAKAVGGCVNDRNVIYAAKCTRCGMLYVGYTTTQLNERFNRHRSDIEHHPNRSELPKHFSESKECNFDRDLEVHILEKNISGTTSMLEAAEDKWILRLKTLAPHGLNLKLNEYGITFKKLFL